MDFSILLKLFSVSARLSFSLSADMGSSLSEEFFSSGSGDLETKGSRVFFLGGGTSNTDFYSGSCF